MLALGPTLWQRLSTYSCGVTRMSNPESFETDRLRLRSLREADVDDLLEYHGDPEVIRYIPWTRRSRDDVSEAIRSHDNAAFSFVAEGDGLVLGWELKATGRVIGQSNTALVSLVNQTADIGWVTHRNFWRQGFAFEATSRLLSLLFTQSTVQRVVANIDTQNPESARLAEKLGMRKEGEFRKTAFTKGEWRNMWLCAILREEFAA